MAVPVIAPRECKPGGGCNPPVQPDLDRPGASELATVAKALGDPTRMRIMDAVRKSSPEAVCQCELLPLFEISQPALAKHLKVLIAAGLLATERRGRWAYYYLADDGPLGGLRAWLSDLTEIIAETRPVHEHASAAVVRARKRAGDRS